MKTLRNPECDNEQDEVWIDEVQAAIDAESDKLYKELFGSEVPAMPPLSSAAKELLNVVAAAHSRLNERARAFNLAKWTLKQASDTSNSSDEDDCPHQDLDPMEGCLDCGKPYHEIANMDPDIDMER